MSGDPPAPATTESTREMLKAYSEFLPDMLKVTAQGIGPYEQALLKSQQEVALPKAQLQAEIYRQLGPLLNKTGIDINKANAQGQAESDLNVIKGTGRELVKEGQETQKLLDPEFYKLREQAGGRMGELLSSIDLSGQLSGGEREELKRAQAQEFNRRGINNSPSNLAALEGAMTFGQAGYARKTAEGNRLQNALTVANQALPAMRSGQDAFQIATGRSSMPNSGDSKFTGVGEVGQQSGQMSQGLLGATSNLIQQQNDINANRRDSLDRANQTLGGIGSLL